MFEARPKLIKIEDNRVHETAKAILFKDDKGKYWVPKGLIQMDKHTKELYIPKSFLPLNYLEEENSIDTIDDCEELDLSSKPKPSPPIIKTKELTKEELSILYEKSPGTIIPVPEDDEVDDNPWNLPF